MLFGHGDDFYNSQNEVKINSVLMFGMVPIWKTSEHLNSQFDKQPHYPEPMQLR